MSTSAERSRQNSRIRSRANQRLLEMFPDQYRIILHEEMHRDGAAHIHSPIDPETLDWWGTNGQAKKSPKP